MGWSLGSHQVLKKSSFGPGIVRACLSNLVWLGAVLVGAFGARYLLRTSPRARLVLVGSGRIGVPPASRFEMFKRSTSCLFDIVSRTRFLLFVRDTS